MPEQFINVFSAAVNEFEEKSIEELISLVGDADQGCKAEAMDRLLVMGLEENYATLEQAIRSDGNANLRNGAMEVLVRFGSLAVPSLIKLLQDIDEEVRNFSAVMLGDICSRESVVPLIQVLRDKDVNVRHGAAEALGRIGDPAALVPLLELLKEEFWVQYPAVTALAAMRDRRAVPHLLDLLGGELITVPAIEALGEIGDPRALIPLEAILAGEEDYLAGAAARAIVRIYRQIDDDCSYKNSVIMVNQTVLLKEIISDKGVDKLKALVVKQNDKETVKAAVTLLGWLQDSSVLNDFFRLLAVDDYIENVESSILAFGKCVVGQLVEALGHPEANVRIVAVRSLRWLGGREDLHRVTSLLYDSNELVIVEALSAMKELAPDECLPRLCELVEKASDPISASAIEVLELFPFAKIKNLLQLAVASADPVQRRRGAQLLGHFSQDVPPGVLGRLLKDSDATVRIEAIRSAGLQQMVETIPILSESLRDVDVEVRKEAVQALAAFGNEAPLQEILQMLGKDRESLDYAIVRAIGRIGSVHGGEALLGYLRCGGIARNIEIAIVETLGEIMYKPAVESITAGYLTHQDHDFRRLAVRVLEKIAGSDGFTFFAKACQDSHWSVRIAALLALGNTCGDRAIPRLTAALTDPDNLVRKNAIAILGDTRNLKAITPLVIQLADPEMGKFAFESLLKSGRSGLPWLHRVIKGDYQLEVREMVINLIGKIGSQKSIEPLLELLNDPHASIRLAAIDSLVCCYDTVPLKRLFHIKRFDLADEVRNRAELALKSLTIENFF
jgi:HEAT repeat protein